MPQSRTPKAGVAPSRDPAALQGGVASPPHQGLHRPARDVPGRDALKQADLTDLGLSVEDRLRDRRNNGTPDRR